MNQEVRPAWIANFWKRIGAFLIDTFLLGLIGFMLGLAFESVFVQLGGWARLIGFAIALTYFGTMNSKLFNGQTVGKKLLSLRIVDRDNQTISLFKSVIRSLVLTVPFSLNGVHYSNDAFFSFLVYPHSMILFGGVFSIIYLYLFNRVTRQSLHDLAVGTYVVNARAEKQEVGKIWKPHLVVVIVFFIAAAIVPAYTTQLIQDQPFRDMFEVQTAVLEEPGVTHASVFHGTTTLNPLDGETQTSTYVTVQAFLSSNITNDVELARKLAMIVIRVYPDALDKDAIRIVLTYGYDIGIWSRWLSRSYDLDTAEFGAD